MTTAFCEIPDCEHVLCIHCDRPIRDANHPKEDHPGTLAGIPSRKRCRGCDARGGPPSFTAPATNCGTCEKPFRPYGTKIADYPDTVLLRSGGVCTTCHRRAARAAAYESQREQKSHYLSDRELARIRESHPEAYAYHMWRRPYRKDLEELRKETA